MKIGIILASFIRSGKIPFLKDKLNMLTRWGTIIGAAIFSTFIGILDGPDDLLSSSKSNIVITLVMLVGSKEKLFTIRSRRNVTGDMGVFGMPISISGPTLAKKLLNVSAICFESFIRVLLCCI